MSPLPYFAVDQYDRQVGDARDHPNDRLLNDCHPRATYHPLGTDYVETSNYLGGVEQAKILPQIIDTELDAIDLSRRVNVPVGKRGTGKQTSEWIFICVISYGSTVVRMQVDSISLFAVYVKIGRCGCWNSALFSLFWKTIIYST